MNLRRAYLRLRLPQALATELAVIRSGLTISQEYTYLDPAAS
jgi:hypothetical protein